ncbi:MAG: glycosyltransferase family 2 protein [Chloroflexota bacterium]|nr:glycosyltransferase [Dehalococcoidia bacterium]MDW8254205.1 glycosyltransferase family 2 protein [Chloroflexota bacterium]
MTSPALPVSVLLCVYTEARWNDMLAAIDSVRRQTLAPQEIVVIVDHNPALAERLRAAVSDVRVIENEEAAGLSGARNTGVRAARSDLVAFLDDDATAAPDWLEQMSRHLTDPRVLGVGSRVEPRWSAAPPQWFPEEFFWVVGCSYRGLPEQTAVVRNPFGGAMCIRKEAVFETGGFRTGIGRNSQRPMGCEETEFAIRATQRWPDRVFLYEPRAVIFHTVPPQRTRFRYFLARCYFEGVSKASMMSEVGAAAGLSEERSYTLRVLPAGVLRGLADGARTRSLAGPAKAAAIIAGFAATVAGFLVESARQRWEALRARLRPSFA